MAQPERPAYLPELPDPWRATRPLTYVPDSTAAVDNRLAEAFLADAEPLPRPAPVELVASLAAMVPPHRARPTAIVLRVKPRQVELAPATAPVCGRAH